MFSYSIKTDFSDSVLTLQMSEGRVASTTVELPQLMKGVELPEHDNLNQ